MCILAYIFLFGDSHQFDFSSNSMEAIAHASDHAVRSNIEPKEKPTYLDAFGASMDVNNGIKYT